MTPVEVFQKLVEVALDCKEPVSIKIEVTDGRTNETNKVTINITTETISK